MRTLFAAAIVMAAGSFATAGTISHELVINPGGEVFHGPDYVTFDLIATIVNDDWTSSGAEATLTTGTFVMVDGQGDIPNKGFWGFVPAMEWGSFYAATGEFPNPSFAEPQTSTPTYREAVWFDAPPNAGAGSFVVARYTIHAPGWDGSSLGTLTGRSSMVGTGAELHEFAFEFIPAPGSLALLGLAGLAIRRRR